jgi:hypothetical protein
VVGFGLILALTALYLVESLAESVEWVYAKEGALKTEIVLRKMTGLEVELEDEEADEKILNARAKFGLICDWINFSVLFGLILDLAIIDLYIDKLIFALLSTLGLFLSYFIPQPSNPASLTLTTIISRASTILQTLSPSPALLLTSLVLSQWELIFLIPKTERLLNPQSKSKTFSNLLIFSIIFSYYTNTSQLAKSFSVYLLILLTITSKLFSPLFPQIPQLVKPNKLESL